MENPKNSYLGKLTVLEVFVAFLAGIMGNKVAEYLQLSPLVVGVVTFICLIILAIVGYTKTHNLSDESVKSFQFGLKFSRFVPKTIIGIIPFGLVLGLLAGIIFGSIDYHLWFRLANNMALVRADFWGICTGVILSVLFGMIFNGPLAGGLAVGFGIGCAAGNGIINPPDGPVLFLIYSPVFIFLALLLFYSEPTMKKIRQVITEPRL